METSTLRKTLLHTALLTTITSAQAQLYFDINGATAGSGTPATAAWNTGTNWSTAAAGDAATVGWTNGQAAIFSAGTEAAGTWTVNVTGTVQTNSITFNGATNNTVHNIAGGTIDMGAGGLALNASAAGGTAGRSKTISSAIIGSGGLTIAANGDTTAGATSNTIFALSGTNTFLGNTTITSGLLGYTSNFGDASNSVILDGGGIVFNTTGNFTRNLQIGSTGGVLRNYGSATSTLTGTLSGPGNIRRTDGGISIYAGDGSAFTGSLLLERGTFQAGNGVLTANPVANASGITLGDATAAATMRYQLDGSFTLATPVTIANTGSTLAWQGTDAGDVMTINNELGITNTTGTLRANSGAITLASGADVLIGTVSLTSTPANSATAQIGTMNIQAGSVLETSFMNIGDGSNTAGIVNQSGGTVTIAPGGSGFRIGHWTNGTLTPGSVYNLSGGTLDVGADNLVLNVGWDGGATMNVSGGVAKAWRLYVDASGVDAPGIVNLTGGTIEVGAGGIANDGTTGSQLNLGGGTLKATTGSTWASLMNANTSTSSVIDVNGSTILSTGGFTGTGSVAINDTSEFGGGILEFSLASGTRTITPSLGGNTTLRKSGAGTVVLAGNNTNTGTLFHDFGTLSLTGTNAFSLIDINDSAIFSGEGSTSGAVSLGFSSGATLSVNPTTPGAFHAAGGLTLNGVNTIALTAPFSGTSTLISYSGALVGNSSNLVLPGIENYRSASINFTPGAITLTNNNANLTWTGTGGGVWDFNATAGWSGGGGNFYWGDTVRFDDTSTVTAVAITGELAPNQITVDADTNAYTFTGSAGNFISGIGSLLKSGSSTLTINSPNTFTGGTVLSEGSIVVTGTDGGLGTGMVTLGDAATGSSSLSLLIGTGRNLANPITVSSQATGSVTIGQAESGGFTQFSGPIALQRDVTLSTFNNTDRLHFGGAITGTGNVTINGGKRITMSGANTFTGNILVRDAGTILQTFGGSPWPDASTVDVGTDSILQVYTSETIGALTGSGILQPVAGKPTLTLGGTNASTTFSGTWRPQGSDHLNLTKTGTGTLTLSGPITSPGALTVNGGVVELTGTGTFGRTQAAGTALPTRAIQGSGIVRTTAGSDVTLRRASTGFTGSFQLNGGVTTIGHSAALATQAVSINGGTVRFDNSGTNFTALANSVLTGGTLTSDVTSKTLATLHNPSGDAVPATTTHVYHGQIYLTAGQWSFGENFDDGASVTIAGTTLFNDSIYNAVTTGTFSAPDDGWYAIDIRVYQVGGAAGGFGDWGTAGIGVGIKAGGTSTNVADYVALNDGALGTRLIISNSYSFSNAITLAGPATFDTSTMVGQPGVTGADGNGTGGDVTLTGIVSGTGSLTKTGAGTLLLNAANTYTGDTRVDAGRLTLATANLANTADVYIASGAVLNLTHTAADTIRSLYINGAALAPGTYTATTHPGVITGPGSLLVTTAGTSSGFDSWASSNGVSGGTGDPDADGIANAIEFVIGGDPSGPNSDSSSLLPTASTDATYLTVVYRRSDASMTMPTAQQPYVEYGSSLTSATWTKAQNGTSGVIITADNDFFGTGIDRVTVKIPKALAVAGKLFGRLRADIP